MIRANPVLHGYTISMIFANRSEAGKQLAPLLLPYKKEQPVILALPRGGVVVAYEIAKRLDAQLDVLIVRKLGDPHNPEFAIGAIAENDTIVLDSKTINRLDITKKTIAEIRKSETAELRRRKLLYRQGKSLPRIQDKTVILIDDGIATGMTMLAAITAVKKHHPRQIIVAAPVCSQDAARMIESKVDIFISLDIPEDFQAIGTYYRNFSQVTDEEVGRLLSNYKLSHKL